MSKTSSVLLLALALLSMASAQAERYAGPIIDVHLHAGKAAPGAINPATGKPTIANTDAQRQSLTLEQMQRHRIVLGLVSGPMDAMARMRAAAPQGIWAGALLDDEGHPLLPVAALRQSYASGELRVLGEIGAQYNGLDPSDPWLEPYLALAEELDIPVGIHTGLGPPASSRTAAARSSA